MTENHKTANYRLCRSARGTHRTKILICSCCKLFLEPKCKKKWDSYRALRKWRVYIPRRTKSAMFAPRYHNARYMIFFLNNFEDIFELSSFRNYKRFFGILAHSKDTFRFVCRTCEISVTTENFRSKCDTTIRRAVQIP